MIPDTVAVRRCHLIGADKLPVSAADRLCETVERAIALAVPGLGYTIEIRVLPRASLAATVITADGRKIPEQRFVAYDRALTRESISRFADSIASELAKAVR